VIPLSGPPSGATRVVILGSNFIESPTTLVKFDNVEVKPYFHGPKTLICHTPKHPPGTVSVKVCNDLGRWSETEASYTYDGTPLSIEEEEPVPVSQEFDINSVLPYLQNCSQSPSAISVDIFSQFNNNFGADIHGFSPLHYCAAFGLLEVLLLLLSGGADPCLTDKFGNTPLFWAVINAHISVVRVLMMNGGLKRTNFVGDTPLHLAAKYGHFDVLNELIVNGAIVDVQNNDGMTPLHYAVMEGDPLIVKELLKAGARADLVTIDGCTSIHLSTLTSSPEILQMLANQSNHYLCSQDEFGDTVVHWAVRHNDESLLQVLIKLGAPFNTSNFDYECPMALALSLNHLNLIPLLKSVMTTPLLSPNSKKTTRSSQDQDQFLPTKPFKQQRVQQKFSVLDRLRPGAPTGGPQKKAPAQSPANSGISSKCNDICLQDCDSMKLSCYYWCNLTGEDNLSTASNWDSLAIG
jgi:ankyrin repeat protein